MKGGEVALVALLAIFGWNAVGLTLGWFMQRDDTKNLSWDEKKKRDSSFENAAISVGLWPLVLGLFILVGPFLWWEDRSTTKHGTAEERAKAKHEARLAKHASRQGS